MASDAVLSDQLLFHILNIVMLNIYSQSTGRVCARENNGRGEVYISRISQ